MCFESSPRDSDAAPYRLSMRTAALEEAAWPRGCGSAQSEQLRQWPPGSLTSFSHHDSRGESLEISDS